jgi:tetratricopeptide (TPR) repeat protein
VPEAIAAYRDLLRVNPDLPDSWYNLGWLERQTRNFDGALAAYREALDRGVASPEEVHVNRAVILLDHLHRAAEAEAELQAALRLAPDYLPALINLGNLHEDRGERVQARACYTRALEVDGSSALALSRLAGVTEPTRTDDPVITAVQDALTHRSSDHAERANLGFALGRLLDRVGQFDAAFDAYTAANQASRAACGAQFRGYQADAAERLVDRLIAAFPHSAATRAPPEQTSRTQVFICGMFRSGSTLVEQILAAHPSVAAGGELDCIPDMVRRKLQPYPEKAASVDGARLQDLRGEYLRATTALGRGKPVLTDKRPDNFLHLGLIKQLFPDARILHTVRNPLDNILSLYFLHLDPGMAYALDLRDAGHWYLQYRRLMAHWKHLYGDDILDVDYDLLVAEPEPVIAGMLSFVGLPWDDACMRHQHAQREVRTASVWQVREPLHQRSSGRWRNYSRQLHEVRDLIGVAEPPSPGQ